VPHDIDPRPDEEPTRPDVLGEADHASRAADALLCLVAVRDRSFVVTADAHDAAVFLVYALAAAIARARPSV
jgi:hypothetical protein